MRLHQLHENADTSALTHVWKGPDLAALVHSLEDAAKEFEDEKFDVLASVIRSAFKKHAETNPTHIFSILKQLIKLVKEMYDAKVRSTTGDKWVHRHIMHHLEYVVQGVVKVAIRDDTLVKQLLSKVEPDLLTPYLSGKDAAQLMLLSKKHHRSQEEEDYDNENELFVFIGRPVFKEVPEGSGNFRKTLEIEQLVKVDGFDAAAHQMVGMMKLRARMQGENSEVYQIRLPAGTIQKSHVSGDSLDDWLIDLIRTHKQLVR